MNEYPYASIHADYIIDADRCFDRLQTLDHELCEHLIAAFGSRYTALAWLMTQPLADDLPIRLLTAGRRSEVLDALSRFEH